jgi:hypothetical protein
MGSEFVRNHEGCIFGDEFTKLTSLKLEAVEALAALHVAEFSRDVRLQNVSP